MEKRPFQPLCHLLQQRPLERRVSVGLLRLGVLGAEDGQVDVPSPAHELPAKVPVQVQQVLGRLVGIVGLAIFHPVPGALWDPLGKDGKGGAKFHQEQPPQGQVLQPALQPLNVIGGHRGEFSDALHKIPSSSASMRQDRRRSTSSWYTARPLGVMR